MRLILGVLFFLCSMMICLGSYANASTRYQVAPSVGGHSVTALCDAGDTFKTIQPVLKCTDWKLEDIVNDQSISREWRCQSYVKEVKTVSKFYMKTCPSNSPPDCADSDRLRKYGNTFEIPVYEDDVEMGTLHVGTVKHTVPACK